jgi:hypothetical protein
MAFGPGTIKGALSGEGAFFWGRGTKVARGTLIAVATAVVTGAAGAYFSLTRAPVPLIAALAIVHVRSVVVLLRSGLASTRSEDDRHREPSVAASRLD